MSHAAYIAALKAGIKSSAIRDEEKAEAELRAVALNHDPSHRILPAWPEERYEEEGQRRYLQEVLRRAVHPVDRTGQVSGSPSREGCGQVDGPHSAKARVVRAVPEVFRAGGVHADTTRHALVNGRTVSTGPFGPPLGLEVGPHVVGASTATSIVGGRPAGRNGRSGDLPVTVELVARGIGSPVFPESFGGTPCGMPDPTESLLRLIGRISSRKRLTRDEAAAFLTAYLLEPVDGPNGSTARYKTPTFPCHVDQLFSTTKEIKPGTFWEMDLGLYGHSPVSRLAPGSRFLERHEFWQSYDRRSSEHFLALVRSPKVVPYDTPAASGMGPSLADEDGGPIWSLSSQGRRMTVGPIDVSAASVSSFATQNISRPGVFSATSNSPSCSLGLIAGITTIGNGCFGFRIEGDSATILQYSGSECTRLTAIGPMMPSGVEFVRKENGKIVNPHRARWRMFSMGPIRDPERSGSRKAPPLERYVNQVNAEVAKATASIITYELPKNPPRVRPAGRTDEQQLEMNRMSRILSRSFLDPECPAKSAPESVPRIISLGSLPIPSGRQIEMDRLANRIHDMDDMPEICD